MDKIGIRELKQNASAVVKDVIEQGSVVITAHGKEVAYMAPLPSSPVKRLRDCGHLRPARTPLSDLSLPEKLPDAPDNALSDALRAMRDDERTERA